MARRCVVCGFETEDAVCPRCSTILLRGQAVCPKCGKLFPGWTAACDACGASMNLPVQGPEDEEAVRLLASVPGISEERAKALVARGYRDLSDILRLALPESEVRRGLHHTIARRLLLSGLGPTVERPQATDRCPVCGARTVAGADSCPTCGSTASSSVPVEAVEEKLQQVASEIVTLAHDEDVREMPDDVRRELLDALGGLSSEDVMREEYRRQVDAWRDRGFDVTAIEALLGTNLEEFRERSVRLIRAQILKRSKGGEFRCPLCDVRLPAAAAECENCGAKFA